MAPTAPLSNQHSKFSKLLIEFCNIEVHSEIFIMLNLLMKKKSSSGDVSVNPITYGMVPQVKRTQALHLTSRMC